jgi:predicted Rossmann fold nucleotide-binding protein DprA/Smf involved in DNA uptake
MMAATAANCWTLRPGDPAYPALRSLSGGPPTLFGVGDPAILSQPILGLICSVKCPGSVVLKTFDAIRELRDAGVVVAGGFHSPMEQECLEFLLRGEEPVIVCPAKHPGGRIPAAWRDAVDGGRLLLVSPFGDDVRRATKRHAEARNEFVASLSAAILIPHASPGGKAEATARRLIAQGQRVFMFSDEGNQALLELGASLYDRETIQSDCAGGNTSNRERRSR